MGFQALTGLNKALQKRPIRAIGAVIGHPNQVSLTKLQPTKNTLSLSGINRQTVANRLYSWTYLYAFCYKPIGYAGLPCQKEPLQSRGEGSNRFPTSN
jgi:hypothetical protein